MRLTTTFAFALLSLLTACSGAAPQDPSSGSSSAIETATAPQRLDDPIVIGSIDWECFDVCIKSFVASYCENACTK